MQFLFMILMSVLVAASALPHVLQAPNRPSFSLRKNTPFSIITIPTLIQRMTRLENELQKKAKMRTLASLEQKKKMDAESEELRELEADEVESSSESSSEEYNENEVGSIAVDSDRLTSCVCQSGHYLRCQLSIEGECSHPEESVILTETDESTGEKRERGLNCREDHSFEANLVLRGNNIIRINLEHLGAQMEAKYNLMNDCGALDNHEAEETEEAIKTRRPRPNDEAIHEEIRKPDAEESPEE